MSYLSDLFATPSPKSETPWAQKIVVLGTAVSVLASGSDPAFIAATALNMGLTIARSAHQWSLPSVEMNSNEANTVRAVCHATALMQLPTIGGTALHALISRAPMVGTVSTLFSLAAAIIEFNASQPIEPESQPFAAIPNPAGGA